MKKVLLKIVLLICTLTLILPIFACGDSESWSKSDVTIKKEDAGEVINSSLGGFVFETKNYVYYINGFGTSTEDNTFGTPIKGALMVAKKSNLTETCIVVPKLFVASDYNAGVYVYDGFVYYGTPSTDKTASGSIANSEMKFCRTDLNGQNTTEYFSVDSLSTEYRIVKGEDNHVYIVYYDSTLTAIKSYDTETKKVVTVAETNEKAEEISLDAYKFVDNDGLNGATVIYTACIFKDEYDENQASKNENYTRAEQTYNKVYAYTAGKESTVILNKENQNKTYSIKAIKNGFLFYTEKDNVTENEKTFGLSINNIYTYKPFEIINTDYVSDTTLINKLAQDKDGNVTEDEIYLVSENQIKVSALTLDIKFAEKTVTAAPSIDTLIKVVNNYVYYYDSNLYIQRLYVGADRDIENKEHTLYTNVSEKGVSKIWFAPEFTSDGKYMFYLDNSDLGINYVKYVEIDSENEVKPYYCEDEEGEIDYYFLENQAILGKVTEEDKKTLINNNAQAFLTKVIDSNGKVKVSYNEDTKVYYNEDLDNAIALDKDYLSDANVTTINNYKEAIRISGILRGVKDFDKAENDTERDVFKTAYESCKKEIDALKESGEFDYDTIYNLLEENSAWFYEKANNYFLIKEGTK